jgi:beta-glucosidase
MEAITMFALPAGNDVEMGGGSFSFKTIPQLIQSGRLSIDIVDQAVSRVLRAKFAMGLFEHPYSGVPASELSRHMHTPEAVNLARRLDAESIVLLENRKNVLPLKKSANIAVIGPMADFMNVSRLMLLLDDETYDFSMVTMLCTNLPCVGLLHSEPSAPPRPAA